MTKKIPAYLWLEPEIKVLAKKVAKLERRSFSNLVDVMLLERAAKHGLLTDIETELKAEDVSV